MPSIALLLLLAGACQAAGNSTAHPPPPRPPPPPPPAASAATISSLQQLQAAANGSATTFIISAGFSLNGAEIRIHRPGQLVNITSAAAGASCNDSRASCPVLDGRGLSRILTVVASRVSISGLRFANGRAAGSGGCVAAIGNASLSRVSFNNCVSGGMGGSVRSPGAGDLLTMPQETGGRR